MPETDASEGAQMGEYPVAETIPWLEIKAVARVHASSEEPTHRIDQAFSPGVETHWRAGEAGEQTIELRFDPPRDLTRIRLVFVEEQRTRTQQFTISWSSHRGETHGEVVRQQFNFSPFGATREVEDYRVNLRDVETLRIRVVPDIGREQAFATLAQLQLA